MSQYKRLKMDTDAPSTSAVTPVSNDLLLQKVAGGGGTGRSSNGDSHNKRKVTTIFNENTSDFQRAVHWKGFVDRTLLIKALLDEPRHVIIFAPRRFGKSLNMDMVKCFFDIEKGRDISKAPENLEDLNRYANFRAFQGCEIMKAENRKIFISNEREEEEVDIVKEYFGRHAVIHIDLKNISIYSEESSVADVKDSLKELVHHAYLQYSYLIYGTIYPGDPWRDKSAKDTCKAWCDEERYMRKDPANGLQKLIEYLHAHHGRKVYFLVDEFDAPAVNALMACKSGQEVYKISSVLTTFLGAIVKGDTAKKHVLGSLITGVSWLSGIGISTPLNNVPAYKWLSSDDRFANYYNLWEGDLVRILNEVFAVLEQIKRDEVLMEIRELYNGYDHKGKRGYCLWSVLHYVRARSTKESSEIKGISFWAGSSIIKQLCRVLDNPDVCENMIKVAGGGSFSFKPVDQVDSNIFARFLCGLETGDPETVYSFFHEQGYLVPVGGYEGDKVQVKCPNAEVMLSIKEMFHYYCSTVCGLDPCLMRTCAKQVKTMMDDLARDNMTRDIKEDLKDLHGYLKTLLSKLTGRIGLNERSVQAVIWATMLEADLKECSVEKHITREPAESNKDTTKSGFIDLWMCHDGGTSAVIWEFKYEAKESDVSSSAREALSEILDGGKQKKVPYVTILEKRKIPRERGILVGLCKGPRDQLSMCCSIGAEEIICE